jgi:hypothetical protein
LVHRCTNNTINKLFGILLLQLTDTKESDLEMEEIGKLCMACGKDFDSKDELQNHMKSEHGA